jgi:uroporphyrinogen-III synthase
MSTPELQPDFRGLRVISLESRRADLMAQLILRHGGVPFVAPSVKEVPFQQHDEVFSWAEKLFSGEFDLVVLMTGVGLAFLRDTLDARFTAALKNTTTLARGPKPAAVLREMGVNPTISVPEPNTWREVVAAIAPRTERRITVQEYGRPNPEFLAALEHLGAHVTPIAIYRWALPDDLAPLREAVRRIAARECDVVMFTSRIQVAHLLEVAAVMGVEADVRRNLAEHIVIASIGPVMDAALENCGLKPDITPPHPKMAALVRAAAENAATILL